MREIIKRVSGRDYREEREPMTALLSLPDPLPLWTYQHDTRLERFKECNWVQ